MIRAKKRFGQHFLRDTTVIDRIIAMISPQANDYMIEIGPGPGILTQPLLTKIEHLHAIEIDRDLCELLHKRFDAKQLNLYEQDVLTFDFGTIILADSQARLAGNLPYNIATELLFHLIPWLANIKDMHFMLQKEVVDRLTAEPGNKVYGRLSVMFQYYCTGVNLFAIPPSAFNPPPKVQSAFMRIIPRQNKEPLHNVTDFTNLVRTAFNQRRKTLHNALKSLLPDSSIKEAGIDPAQRAETISVKQYVKLANIYSQNNTL